mmetsp:Transcript_8331/g.20404  ORF Transcript_8331/g.20404 Transcript_8331/m.20404 type:complete len:603 (-) Transcript_8331:2-1810(-)
MPWGCFGGFEDGERYTILSLLLPVSTLQDMVSLSLISKTFHSDMQHQGFDCSVTSLLLGLAGRHRPRRVRDTLLARSNLSEWEGEVLSFVSRVIVGGASPGGAEGAVDSWVKRALLLPDGSRLSEGASFLVSCGWFGAANFDQWTPAHYSAVMGSGEQVQRLLGGGGSDALAVKARDGATPLHLACRKGNADTVEALVEAWGSTDPVHMGIEKAMEMACMGGHIAIVEMLAARGYEGLITDAINGSGWTSLMFASMHDNLQLVDYLAERGGQALVMAQNMYRQTALMVSVVHRSRVEVVKRLAERGSQELLMLKQWKGDTVLMQAASLGDLATVKYLCEKGGKALMMETDDQGCTVLMKCCQHIEIVEYLAKMGGEDLVLASDFEGKTALMIAARSSRTLDAVTVLCNVGGAALLMAQNCRGETALHMASDFDVVKVLAGLGGSTLVARAASSGETVLMKPSRQGRLDAVQYLSSIGDDALVVAKTRQGKTCMMMAAEEGHLPVVKFLYERGGDELLMSRDYSEGKTALMCAAKRGNLDVVRFLCEKGGDELIHARNNNGDTSIRYAGHKESGVMDDVIAYLRRKGDASNPYGMRDTESWHD